MNNHYCCVLKYNQGDHVVVYFEHKTIYKVETFPIGLILNYKMIWLFWMLLLITDFMLITALVILFKVA